MLSILISMTRLLESSYSCSCKLSFDFSLAAQCLSGSNVPPTSQMLGRVKSGTADRQSAGLLGQ